MVDVSLHDKASDTFQICRGNLQVHQFHLLLALTYDQQLYS